MTSPIAWINGRQAETGDKRIRVQKLSERITTWPEDDWSGVSDPKQRRRLQNRLNQRVRRLRKRKDTKSTSDGESSDAQHAPTSTEDSVSRSAAEVEDVPVGPTLTSLSLAAVEDIHILQADSIKTKRILQQIEVMAHTQYMLGSPRTDMLLHLIQFNFIKALVQNMRVLGLTSELLHDDAISPFNVTGPWQYDIGPALPASLRPTIIQRTVVHHPWLDLLPIPEMRDNLISAGESYDEAQLCLDMKGYGKAHTDYAGIIVWSDPWDQTGWEVTEPFTRSWGWTVRGCVNLFNSTNSWRARRNERPLFRVS
ncbi:uncharacterized protein BDV14DRAFT_33846 [Aspergillus stella-maris]|uniref:uncharacterized protein n=1 Tax=Aspergillus stella-maris TaxID=1810926 RepID=UPI003CCE238A